MEENEEEYENDDQYIEQDDELPPDAKEYYDYKNQVDIMEKEKKLLESTLKEAKQSYYSNKSLQKTKQKSPFHDYDSKNYREYEKQILNNMMNEELFGDVGTSKEILGEFVDKVLHRSLYLYKNRNCHTCAVLLSKGMSTQKCPKCHHLLRQVNKVRKKSKKI